MKLRLYVNISMLLLIIAAAGAGHFFRSKKTSLAAIVDCAKPVVNDNRLRCDGNGQHREFVKVLLSQKMDLNRVSIQDLDLLPGISTTVAVNIVEFRAKIGSYHSLKDLLKVKMVGEKTFSKLQEFVTLPIITASNKPYKLTNMSLLR